MTKTTTTSRLIPLDVTFPGAGLYRPTTPRLEEHATTDTDTDYVGG